VVFELGPNPGKSIIAEAEALAGMSVPSRMTSSISASEDGSYGDAIVIRYLGQGRTSDGANEDGQGDADGPDSPRPFDETNTSSGVVAFNPATGNEFLITTSTAQITAIAMEAERSGLNRETTVEPPAERLTASSGDTRGNLETELQMLDMLLNSGSFGTNGFSGGNDDRQRPYGVNAPVTQVNDRRRVQLGSGCSGTLVGPRHVVTAAHCIYSRSNQAWSNNFNVRAGANGTSFVGSVLVNSANIPAGQVLWYFTPVEWRNPATANTHPFDFGILVLPGNLGNTAGGWYGWWTLTDATLQQQTINRAGYPLCAATSGGVPRIDVPSTDSPLPCFANHLYANTNQCQVGNFLNAKDGWNRNLDHSCDASGGDSGSGLTTNFNNQGNGVIGIHFRSLCGKTPADVACTGALNTLPLRATRITPEYSGWISYFRNRFP
jgi:V8-like Glu-specific endopeptidase